MSVRQFVFSLLIKLGGVSEAKAGAAEVQRAVAGVTDETKTAIPVVDRETSATRKNADARRDAAKAAREQAEAERKAREAAQRAVGGTVPGAPSGGGIPNPMPGGGIPTSPAVSPWAMTADQAALRAQVEPAFAALQQYRQELALVAKAEAAGAITKAEAAAAQQRLRMAYDRTTEGIRRGDAAFAGASRSIRLQAHEARNLSYQMSDLFQGVVLGMPPMMILMQQGPQIVDIFGGVGNTLRYVGQQLTATRVLMGGTAAAVIGGAMAWERYVRSLKAAELAAATGGRRLGVSAGMIGDVAEAVAENGNLSRPAARDLISQLAGSGMINPTLLGGIAGISKDFGVTMGIEANAVGAAMVKAFSAPGETAERLRKEGGYILAQDVERIQRLEAQNRLYEAQAVLLDAIKPRLADAADAQSAIGRSVSGAGRRFGNIWDSFGRMVDDAWEGMPAISANPWVSILAAPTTAREVASRRAARQAAETDAALASRPEEERRRLGILAGVAAARAPANTNIRQERTLADDITAMRAGLAADDLSAEARAEITRAIESQSRALDALINRRERALTLDRLDLQIATERDPLRRAELAGLKALVDGYGKGTPFEDWLADAQRARRQALSETLAASSNQAASMQEEAAARERLLALRASGAVTAASADEWLDRELTLRPLITAATRAEGDEKTQLEGVIAGLQEAYERLTKARKDAASQDEAEVSRQRLADLRMETELIGRSAADRIRAQAAHDVEKRILDMNLDPKSDAAADRRAEAMAEAEARILRDRRQREYDLDTQRMLARYDATARLAPDPISRAAIEAEREYARAIAEGADATEAAAQAALVRSRALSEQQGALQDALRAQDDQIARLRLEIALAGSSEAARARALAVYDAEVQARRMGYEVGSQEAEMMRDGARAAADLTTELERQRDAWDKVHRAAEGMIDGPIDALLKGDIKGALASFAQEFMGLYTELAWKNPVKNKLLGTNYATLDDVGGLGGIFGRLFGGAQAEPLAVAGAGPMSPASMAVTTPMVNISTSGLSGLPLAAGLAPAANSPFAPGGSAATATLQAVAAGGALRAGAIGNLNTPFAAALSAMVAEAQQMFGAEAVRVTSAFRSIEHQAQLWAQALQKYGSAAEARKWVAPPGASNHNYGLAADLSYGSPAVQQWFHANAGRFGLGYRMGNEPWHIEPANVQAAKAGQALPVAQLERLATSAEMATGQLTGFGARAETTGQGLAAMGGTFAQALQMLGASRGPGGMVAATLLGGLFKGIGIPGFQIGGPTGGSDPSRIAGLVHEEEFVFDATATRRIGVANLEAIRRGRMPGYQTGGYVVGGRPAAPAGQRAAMAAAVSAGPAEQRHLFEINVSGTGDAQIAAGVREAITRAFDEYDRNVFAGRVRMVVKDDWTH